MSERFRSLLRLIRPADSHGRHNTDNYGVYAGCWDGLFADMPAVCAEGAPQGIVTRRQRIS